MISDLYYKIVTLIIAAITAVCGSVNCICREKCPDHTSDNSSVSCCE